MAAATTRSASDGRLHRQRLPATPPRAMHRQRMAREPSEGRWLPSDADVNAAPVIYPARHSAAKHMTQVALMPTYAGRLRPEPQPQPTSPPRLFSVRQSISGQSSVQALLGSATPGTRVAGTEPAVVSRSLYDFGGQLRRPPKQAGAVYPMDLSPERLPRAAGGNLPRPGYTPTTRSRSPSPPPRLLVSPVAFPINWAAHGPSP